MNNGLVSARYASALFEFAENDKKQTEVYEQVKKIAVVLQANKPLKQVLSNPVAADTVKKKLLTEIVEGGLSAEMNRFFDMLLQKRRIDNLLFIMLKYIDLYRERNSINHGKLTTAFSLDAKIEKKLTTVLGTKIEGKLEIEKEVDPDLLGGFVLEVDNLRWDASLAGQLRKIRKNLTDENANLPV
ncbi:MAG: F0F1 ATP synthase subunit delta [Paludibacter sp.]|nr:F0F1 ATP synthase subunit delta [Paludibacter sp.]